MIIPPEQNQNEYKQEKILHYIVWIYAIVITCFICAWWKNTPGMPPAGRMAGLLSAVLFSVVIILFMKHWSIEWQPLFEEQTGPKSEPIRTLVLIRLFFTFLMVDVFIVLLIFFLQWRLFGQTSFKNGLTLWSSTDSFHYLNIAREWYLSEGPYDRLVELAFLPGFPLAVRAVASIIHNYLYAGMLVSAVSFAGAETILYCLARLDMDHRTAMRVLRYTVILPGSFFFASPQTESLFLLLSVSCIYLARKKAWFPACLLGGLSAFTKSVGIILLVPVAFELIYDSLKKVNQNPSRSCRSLPFLMLLMIPSGFFLYCLICKKVSGNPFQWMIYEKDYWHQQMGLFFQTAAYQTEKVILDYRSMEYTTLFGIWIPNLIVSFSALLIMAFTIHKMRLSYGAYFISYYVIAFGATFLLSAPRYALVLFPIVFGIADITKKRSVDILLSALAIIISVLYTLMFIARCQVW